MIRRIADYFDLDLDYYLSGASLLLVDQAATLATALATTWCFTNSVPCGCRSPKTGASPIS